MFIKKNKTLITTFVAVIAFVFASGFVLASMPKTITLNINNEIKEVTTSSKTVREALLEEGLDLEKLEVENNLDDKVKNDLEIIANTEKTVKFTNKGTMTQVSTYTNTVEDFLKEQGIVADDNDLVSPSRTFKIIDNLAVKYDDVEIEKYDVEEVVEFEEEKEYSFDLAYGETEVKTEGKDGKQVVNKEKTSINGELISDKEVDTKIIEEPVKQVTVYGSKEVVEKSIDFETVKKNNSSMYKGESKVVQKGSNGLVKETYENKGEDDRTLVKKETIKEAVDKIIEVGTKARPAASGPSSSSALYSLRQFKFNGVVRWGGYKFTYYSQSVLPGGGLRIPGRHVNGNGYVADSNGYIVLAAGYGIPKGTVINTPFGGQGKVYDRCGNCSPNWYDVYVK